MGALPATAGRASRLPLRVSAAVTLVGPGVGVLKAGLHVLGVRVLEAGLRVLGVGCSTDKHSMSCLINGWLWCRCPEGGVAGLGGARKTNPARCQGITEKLVPAREKEVG